LPLLAYDIYDESQNARNPISLSALFFFFAEKIDQEFSTRPVTYLSTRLQVAFRYIKSLKKTRKSTTHYATDETILRKMFMNVRRKTFDLPDNLDRQRLPPLAVRKYV
jgi:hypothetical protein